MKDFFVDANADAEIEERIQRVEKNKGSRKYVPQKNSAAYALLITLYRPEIGKGKAGQFGVSSGREWYSGWNCMKNLIDKGLAVKSSCPAKYMLTQQGKEAARDCLARSGLADSTEGLATINNTSDPVIEPVSTHAQLVEDSPPQRASIKRKKKSVDIPPDTLDKLVRMGYTKQQVTRAFSEVAKKSPNEEASSLWLSVLCRLREVEVYNSPLESENVPKVKHHASSNSFMHKDSRQTDHFRHEKATLASEGGPEVPSSSMRPCSSTCLVRYAGFILGWPPSNKSLNLKNSFVWFNRIRMSQRSSKLLQQVKLHFKIPIEVRRLPVGDGIWIARHKQLGSEYVLDFIVERKNVDDLRSSIRDNRYREQKVRILVIYLMANKYVPEEIILQIISKLPVKPLLRFKCVSKHWNLLISDPIFMKSRSRRILLISGNPIHAIDNNVPVNDKANLAFKLHSPFAEGKYASVAGTVNGIVLLFIHCDMILYNPLTSAYKKVPDHPHIHRGSRNYDVYGFGYGTTPDDLKIVIISSTQRRGLRSCDVYNLKTTSWNKPLELIGNYDFGDEYKGVFVNGFLYWNVYLSEQRSRILLALDVNKMVFSEIQDSIRHLTRFPLGTFKGRLCMIWLNRIRFKLELWVMNEHGLRTSFSKVCQLTSLHTHLQSSTYRMMCILDDGKIALSMNRTHKYVIYDMLNDSYETVTTLPKIKFGFDAIEYVESCVSPSLSV
ncbi:restriction endonuclease, type II-like superfamily protein [Artemisia annua]|uniref:Crossover junction endonuclease MUS81 n=1 Tax=Artemisia annua TaxID=35608 RepID=A0A2U1KEW7_ARTAN|nr:restriction endonuclease, type II-like superfamily protein [Artemisia annua]